MKSFSFPTNSGDLIQLGEKMEAGVTKIGASIPIIMVTAAQIHDATEAFKKADYDFNTGRTTIKTCADAYTQTQDGLYQWLLSVTKMLSSPKVFGTRYTNYWLQAGYINNSTAVPQTIDGRVTLALSLVQFFTNNPNYEVPSLDLTAAYGTLVRTALLTAQQAATDAQMDQIVLGTARTAAYDALLKVMTKLLKNLESDLNDDDTRWPSFGLPIPASIVTPGQPTGLTAHEDGQGNIIVTCDAVPNTTRYRCRKMVVGVDEAYALADSETAPILTVSGIAPGQTVKLIVQAVNYNLQGVASGPITYTVLLPEAKAKAASAPVLPTLATEALTQPLGTNGNGHGNGESNGHAAPSSAAKLRR